MPSTRSRALSEKLPCAQTCACPCPQPWHAARAAAAAQDTDPNHPNRSCQRAKEGGSSWEKLQRFPFSSRARMQSSDERVGGALHPPRPPAAYHLPGACASPGARAGPLVAASGGGVPAGPSGDPTGRVRPPQAAPAAPLAPRAAAVGTAECQPSASAPWGSSSVGRWGRPGTPCRGPADTRTAGSKLAPGPVPPLRPLPWAPRAPERPCSLPRAQPPPAWSAKVFQELGVGNECSSATSPRTSRRRAPGSGARAQEDLVCTGDRGGWPAGPGIRPSTAELLPTRLMVGACAFSLPPGMRWLDSGTVYPSALLVMGIWGVCDHGWFLRAGPPQSGCGWWAPAGALSDSRWFSVALEVRPPLPCQWDKPEFPLWHKG